MKRSVLAGFLFLVVGAAVAVTPSAASVLEVPKSKLLTYRVVLSAQKGTLKRLGRRDYQLAVDYRDHGKISRFSSRSHKSVKPKPLSLARFLFIWFIRKNSLHRETPYVVLSVSQLPHLTAKLTDLSITKQRVIYHLRLAGPAKLPSSKVLTGIRLVLRLTGNIGGENCMGLMNGATCGASSACEWPKLAIYTPDSGVTSSCLCMPKGGGCDSKNPNPFVKGGN
jgi:hypothetical protein